MANYVIIIVFLAILVIGGLYLSNINENDTQDTQGTAKKAPDQPELCGNNIFPAIYCDNNQDVICDSELNQWRCKLSGEDPENNPFPYDFLDRCNLENIKTDSNGLYYCKSDYCKNGGILYNNSSGDCSCPIESAYTGKKCDILRSQCKGGLVDPSDNSKCQTCCNIDTLIDDKCRYYNGPGNKCEYDCELDEINPLKNGVYDNNQEKCVCPDGFELQNEICRATPSKCISSNTQKDSNGTNIINDNGLCECKINWTGPLCDIKKCGDNGTFKLDSDGNPTCVCDPGYVGDNLRDRCKYSRASCNNHGNPVIDANGNMKCDCDNGWKGSDNCACELAKKPTDDDCRGVTSICTSTGWVKKERSCDEIYKYYNEKKGNPNSLDPQEWLDNCSLSILGSQQYNDKYTAMCKDGQDPKFYGQRTCNSPMTNEEVQKCKNTSGCYINDGNSGLLNYTYNSACLCQTDSNNNPYYSCVPLTNNNDCGLMPPNGFCRVGGKAVDPLCLAPQGKNGKKAWACPNSTVSQDVARLIWNVGEKNSDGNIWYKSNISETTIYPTINMDSCKTNTGLFDTLYYPNINPGYESLGSSDGFVEDLGTENPLFFKENDIKNNNDYLLFNNRIGDVVVNNEKINFDEFRKRYSANNNILYNGQNKLVNVKGLTNNPYYDDMIIPNNKKCAVKTSIDDINKCPDNSKRIQICTNQTDNSYTVVPCDSSKKQYIYDKVLCKCNTYQSLADNTTKQYMGDICQYDDNNTCSKKGIVNYKGICNCNTYNSLADNTSKQYQGDKCQYDDNNTCNGHGIVNNDGSCICIGKNRDVNCNCIQKTGYISKFGKDCYSSVLTTLDINNNLIISQGGIYYMKVNTKYIGSTAVIDNVIISKYDDSEKNVIFTNNDDVNCKSITSSINYSSNGYGYSFSIKLSTNTGVSIYSHDQPYVEPSDVPYSNGNETILGDDGKIHFIIYIDLSPYKIEYSFP